MKLLDCELGSESVKQTHVAFVSCFLNATKISQRISFEQACKRRDWLARRYLLDWLLSEIALHWDTVAPTLPQAILHLHKDINSSWVKLRLKLTRRASYQPLFCYLWRDTISRRTAKVEHPSSTCNLLTRHLLPAENLQTLFGAPVGLWYM